MHKHLILFLIGNGYSWDDELVRKMSIGDAVRSFLLQIFCKPNHTIAISNINGRLYCGGCIWTGRDAEKDKSLIESLGKAAARSVLIHTNRLKGSI
jgi:hypothetical protein